MLLWRPSTAVVSGAFADDDQNIPPYKVPYISAVSDSAITLSGPPSILNRFLTRNATLRSCVVLPLPIYGAFHAPHLPRLDIKSIVGPSETWDRAIPQNLKNSLVIGTSLGDRHKTLRDIVTEAISNILHQPLDFTSIAETLRKKTHDADVRVIAFGPAHVNMLKRALTPSRIERIGSSNPISTDIASIKDDYRDAIAIVGMACRAPGAQNVDELWDLLLQGKDMHRQIPTDRFDVNTHYDPTGNIPNTTITQWGCFDDHVGEFDTALFKMSPREALQTDPCHRMMLITGYEALQDAGYYDTGELPRPKFGTFYGQAGDDYRQVNSGQNIDTNYITGGIRAFAPGRVSYYFGWEGPSMNIDTACSSSAVAINQACSSLRLGECDLALAGGVNLLTSSDFFAGLSRAKFISTTGPCKTLDETADGYCRADGAGSIVVKRYQDALRDNDNILGVIRSIETAHAGTAISITHPEADTQVALFQNILSKIGMDARDIDHVEMHGTGTQAGDLAETTSIVGLLQSSKKPRPSDRPLTIASIKPNVGHSEGASGVTSLIKALLMFRHRINPRHIGIKTRPNPKLPPLSSMGIEVPLQHKPYTPTTDKRRILVNNFNATGGVTAMVVEEHVSWKIPSSDPRSHYPILLSATNQKSLAKSIKQMLEYLDAKDDVSIADLSYTLGARRLHHSWRFSCVAGSVNELVKSLRREVPSFLNSSKCNSSKPIVFVFTGQAVSYAGMGHVLFRTNKVFREHLQRADALCNNMGFPSFLGAIDHDRKVNLSDLSATQAHLALVALEIALAYLLETWGIRPSYVLGHSIGEYSALCVSGALSISDTLYLVGQRAQLIERHCRVGEYSMVATSLTENEARQQLAQFHLCEIACLNGPRQTVISGESRTIHAFAQSLSQQGIKNSVLALDYAFHSAQMDVILEEYQSITSGITIKEPSIPLVSSCLGEAVRGEQLNTEYLVRQTRQSVQFSECIEWILRKHPEQAPLWVELGPAPACMGFINAILDPGTADTVATLNPRKSNWRTISDTVAGYYSSIATPRLDVFHKEYIDSLQLLRTPSYPFDMAKYWMQYEGDWSITKHRTPASRKNKPEPISLIKSSVLHRLESDMDDQKVRKLVFGSDLCISPTSNTKLFLEMDGLSITGSSVFIDMAITATIELWNRSRTESPLPMLELSSWTLFNHQNDIEKLAGKQIRLTATQDHSKKEAIDITITTNQEGDVFKLSECKVLFGDLTSSRSSAEETSFLYHSRMDLIEMFHKATFGFSGLYIQSHLGQSTNLQEIILNPGTREAIATWSYQPAEGEHGLDPSWTNALLQIPEFTLAHEGLQCILCDLGSLRLLTSLRSGARYRVHSRLSNSVESSILTASLHVFDEQYIPVSEIKNATYRIIGSSATNMTKQEQQVVWSGRDSQQIPLDGSTLLNSAASPCDSDSGSPNVKPLLPSAQALHETRSFSPLSDISTPASMVQLLPPKSPSQSTISTSVSSPATSLASGDKLKATYIFVDTDNILGILAEELGVTLATINENELLEDLGVDSIMAMTLIAQMQKGVGPGLKLPGELLVKHNTFKKLRTFFQDWQG